MKSTEGGCYWFQMIQISYGDDKEKLFRRTVT